MEDSFGARLGSSGVIKKHEFVRIIIQCLYSLGYLKAAASLESESGILYKGEDLKQLESRILDADWEESIRILDRMKGLTDEIRSSAQFLLFRQSMLECLSRGDYTTALVILQKQLSGLEVGNDKVHGLAFDLLSAEAARNGALNEKAAYQLRKKLVVDMESLLPAPIVVPERRLEHLVETVIVSQIDSCMYHNSTKEVSLYEDHLCDRDQIPTETVQILTEHKNEVWFVQFSNNGEYLASSSSDCTAIIWKVLEDGKLIVKHTFQSHNKPVSYVAWSPDDTMLLTCGNAEVVKLWDVETGTCKRTFGGHGLTISSCAWFPDSKRLVCGSSDAEKGIYMWDCDGNEIRVWKGMRMPKVLDLAVTADGTNIICVFSEKEVRIFNLLTNSELIIPEENPKTSLAASPDGKFFTVNLNSQEIHMWDVAGEWQKPLVYSGHEQKKYVIRSCFGGVNSAFIASGSENSQVYIWNRRCSEPIANLSGHTLTVNCVSWNPKRPQMLASASDDHTIRIWGPCRSAKVQPGKRL